MDRQEIEHIEVVSSGVRLHVAAMGPAEGPLLILLHGFPEHWYAWRGYLEPLARAGFRVYAPDQRGYNLSDKPAEIREYAIDRLAGDVLALIDHAGKAKAHVVGHDWGAGVAWATAILHADRVETLTVINVPHPSVMRDHVLHHLRQTKKSWYMFAFQLPLLPELALTLEGGRWMAERLRRTARRGAMSEDLLSRHREAWARPGAARGMINWYRAAFRHTPTAALEHDVAAPTLIIWGVRDAFLDPAMVEPSRARCRVGRAVMIEEATHWVPHEEPERVQALIVAHCAAEKVSGLSPV